MKKLLMILWILCMTGLTAYSVFVFTRSLFYTSMVIAIFAVFTIAALWKERTKMSSSGFRAVGTGGPRVWDLEHLEIEKYKNSIVISKQMESVTNVGIRVDAVKKFEQDCQVNASNIPVYMACCALKLPVEKISFILNSKNTHKIQELVASERKATRHWGKDKIYYIQLNSFYL